MKFHFKSVVSMSGITSIFKLPRKTSIWRYGWVGGFLKYLVDVIPWQYGENFEEILNTTSTLLFLSAFFVD